MMAREHLHADRQAVDEAGRDRHRRVAVEVRDHREPAHLHEVGEARRDLVEQQRRHVRERGRTPRARRPAAPRNPSRATGLDFAESTKLSRSGCSSRRRPRTPGSGLVAAMMKSTSSNAAAIARYACTRSSSATAAARRLYSDCERYRPIAISSVRSGAHAGHRSPSSASSVERLPIIHCAARFGSSMLHVDLDHAVRGDERVGRRAHPRLDRRLDGHAAQARDHRDAPAAQLVRAELRLPSRVCFGRLDGSIGS